MKHRTIYIIAGILAAALILPVSAVKLIRRCAMKRVTLTALALFFMLPLLGAASLAVDSDQWIVDSDQPDIFMDTEKAATQTSIESGDAPQLSTVNYPLSTAFTPSGTGTVTDRAADGDGKDFYTITTPDESVFYLIIDHQRGTDNVYFLNTVTVADLLSLAELPEQPAPVSTATATGQPPASPEPEPQPAPEPSGGMGMMLLIAAVVVIGGGAAWYFKVYRPKQQGTPSREDTPEDWNEPEETEDMAWYNGEDVLDQDGDNE